MTNYIKSLGYRFTTKDTLNPLEFRLIDIEVSLNEELSTFAKAIYDRVEVYELCLSKKAFKIEKITELLDGIRDLQEVVKGTAKIEEQERSYFITITFTKEV